MKRDSSKKRSKLQVVSTNTKLLNEDICFEVYSQKLDSFCKKNNFASRLKILRAAVKVFSDLACFKLGLFFHRLAIL